MHKRDGSTDQRLVPHAVVVRVPLSSVRTGTYVILHCSRVEFRDDSSGQTLGPGL